MAKPYDLYIRYLITKGMNELKEVNTALRTLSLQEISQAIYDKQYGLIVKSAPKGILRQMEDQQLESDYPKWMKVLEVGEMWDMTPETKRQVTVATSINDDPHLRLCINALISKGLSNKDIVDSVNPKFSCMLKEKHIEIYRKYFFDPQRLTRTDWKSFLKECDNREKHIYFTALSEPVDILKTELELPTQINITEPLQFLLTKSYQKAKQYLAFSTKESNAEARAWIGKVVELTDKYMKYKVSDTTDFAKTLQMEFDYVDNDFPSPDAETLRQLQAELTANTKELSDANE